MTSHTTTTPADPSARLARLLAAVLAVITLLLYWPVKDHEFVNYDDHLYITDNKPVQQGLNWAGVVWAFREPHVSNWHPVTWLSHLLDCSLFGLNAGPHHVVNVIFHCANSVLLLLLLARMTGALWPAALVAALFAWHPLHVESVAWVAERKDVLSTFFWLLTLWAWVRHVERPSRFRYGCALLWCALGLMSKAMLVTLPFVLLLLEVWPLRRLRLNTSEPARAGGKPEHAMRLPVAPRPLTLPSPPVGERVASGRASGPPLSLARSLWRLALEKWPFFALSAVFSLLALVTQRDMAMVPMAKLPLADRLGNALISYVSYAAKMCWPADLAVLYPYPDTLPLAGTGAAAVLLAAITWGAVRLAGRHPYLLVGWFWYLGTLVPVIGFVQVGSQCMADRYTYVPFIGLFIALAWGLADLVARWPRRRALIGVGVGVALCGCLVVTRAQLRHWQNSITLFEQAIRATQNNWVAHYNLGLALARAGRVEEAIAHYNEVTRIDQGNLDALNNLGNALARQGRQAEAAAMFAAVLKARPEDVDALNNLALALSETGKLEEAVALLQRALQLKPDFAKAHQNLALAYLALRRPDDALKEFEAALAANPELVEAHAALAFELSRRKRHAEAQAHFREALRLRPDFVEGHTGLGLSLAAQQRLSEAAAQFFEAARLKSDDPRIRLYLGSALAGQGRRADALEQYREAYRHAPDWPPLLANYAWLLAAAPEAALRNGPQAVQMAERACELTKRQAVEELDALAVAYAETGRFAEATATAQQALTLALAAGNDPLAANIRKRIGLYQAGQPFREPP